VTVALQIGEVEADHKVCLRAQLDATTPRTLFIVDRDHPGADAFDAFAMASTTLTAASVALRQAWTGADLAQKALEHAKTMYEVAKAMKANFRGSIPECAKTYKAEVWEQFMMLNTTWLYRATEYDGFRQARLSQLGCSVAPT
jgi:Glycosyl hydrolase family 9